MKKLNLIIMIVSIMMLSMSCERSRITINHKGYVEEVVSYSLERDGSKDIYVGVYIVIDMADNSRHRIIKADEYLHREDDPIFWTSSEYL